MSIPLQPEENVYYPMPYVEGEPHLLVITNQRVVHFGDEGKQEMPARQIQFVGRMSARPLVAMGVVLALCALPMIGMGIYWVATSGIFSGVKVPGLPAGVIPGDDPSVAAPEEEAEGEEGDDPAGTAAASADSGKHPILGFVFAPLGLILLVVGVVLLRVQRHYVIMRGGPMAMQIRTANTMEQTQILATVGALQSSAKAMGGGMPAPAAPAAAEVDDKGDPVKALQELAAGRAAGKVSEEDFQAKREVLLARARARK